MKKRQRPKLSDLERQHLSTEQRRELLKFDSEVRDSDVRFSERIVLCDDYNPTGNGRDIFMVLRARGRLKGWQLELARSPVEKFERIIGAGQVG